MLACLKAAYPNSYKDITKNDANEMIVLYQRQFATYDSNLVMIAVEEMIGMNAFPPSIAEIKDKIRDLTAEKKLPTDLWASLKKAIRNSAYHSVEEFEKLPEECKMFIKSPSQLKELSQNKAEINNTVVKGQFLKQVETIQKRMREEKNLLPETRKFREMALGVGQNVNECLNK